MPPRWRASLNKSLIYPFYSHVKPQGYSTDTYFYARVGGDSFLRRHYRSLFIYTSMMCYRSRFYLSLSSFPRVVNYATGTEMFGNVWDTLAMT